MIYTHEFDDSAINPDNLITDERHVVQDAIGKVIVADNGLFYTKSTQLRNIGTGSLLSVGVDFNFIGFDDEITAKVGYECAAGIEVFNIQSAVTLGFTYQAVGGREGNYSSILNDIRNRLDAASTGMIPFSRILNPPSSLPAQEHLHPINTDLTELQLFRDTIDRLTEALLGSRVIPESIQDNKNRFVSVYKLMGELRNDLNQVYLMGEPKAFPIMLNQKTITEDFTIGPEHNGFSVGPVTIARGVTVTVDPTSVWVIR